MNSHGKDVFANSSVNNKIHMLNKTIKNIMSNYIPCETNTCNDGDPPWINKDIKQLTLDKNHAYKLSQKNTQIPINSEFVSW